MMRIALVAPVIPDYGLEFAEVAGKRCQVDLFIADRFFTSKQPGANGGHRIEWVRWPRQRQLATGMVMMYRLAQQIRRARPDVVHILAEGNLWSLALQTLLRPIPIVTTVHDVEFHPGDHASQRVPRSLINLLISRSDAIVVHGESLRRLIATTLPRYNGPIFTFPHIPLVQYKRTADALGYARRAGSRKVLFFGRIYDYKGLDYLLEAAPRIRSAVPDVEIVVAGSGDITKYEARLRTMDYVEVRNRFIPFEETARLFAEADLLVLPYIEASQSGVLMTAMAFGLPVVATDVGEMSATITETGCGLLVPPRDANALAQAVASVLGNSALKDKLSTATLAAMANRYSAASLSAELEGLYNSVRSGRGSPAPRAIPGPECS